MRRASALVLGLALLGAAPAFHAYAQSRDADDQRRQAEAEADKKKKEKEKQWATSQAPLDEVKNAGPCPYVKVLYDASRYVELKNNKEAADAVAWTGEIEKVRSACQYKSDEPIKVQIGLGFALGRGPQAPGDRKTYRYWVAVTQRNQMVLDKQTFELPVQFKPGEDRVGVTDQIQDIVIPRADAKVNGSNFEVLVGFEVTPEMAEFNREGKRFRVNAGGTEVAAATK